MSERSPSKVMTDTRTIKFGIIGCGMIGKYHAEAIKQSPNAVLQAVYDTNLESAKRLSEEYACLCATTWDALFQEVDAVAICVPSDCHYDAVIRSARAKKHIICEKPISPLVAEAEEMIQCCQNNNVLLSVVFQHRFDPAVQAVKEAIQSEEIGRVLWASSRSVLYREQTYYTEKAWHRKFGSVALLNQAIHYIDLLVYLLGDPLSVIGQYSNQSHPENENENLGLAIVNFPNQVPAVIEGTTASYPGLFNEISIYGENGTFIIRNDELFSYWLKSGKKQKYEDLLNPNATYTEFRDATIDITAHKKQYCDFINAILSQCRPAITGSEGLRSLRLVQAIYESSDTKRMVGLI